MALIGPASPLVSVILPTRGRPELLLEAIASVRRQTYSNVEILVVNDGGPSLSAVIARLGESRVRLCELERSLGPGGARNAGLELARGEIVAYLDDDDLFLEDHLETLVAALQERGAPPVAYTTLEHRTLRQDRDRWQEISRRPEAGRPFDPRLILVRNFIPLICLAHTTRRGREAGGFAAGLPTLEDWELVLRLTDGCGARFVPRATAVYRHFEGAQHVNTVNEATLAVLQMVYAARPAEDPEVMAARREHLAMVAGLIRAARRTQAPRFNEAVTAIAGDLDQGNTSQATRRLTALLETLPDDGELLQLLARVMRAGGQEAEADQAITRARERDPFLFAPSAPARARAEAPATSPAADYRVTAIVSAYRSARFMRGRLEDLRAQTLHARGQLQIVVVDSGSPEDERAIVEEVCGGSPHVVYVRTERESVYGAWNRGVDLARGRYVINANTDDRFAVDALQRLSAVLDSDASSAAAYGDWLITSVENDTLDSETPKILFRYPAFHPPLLLYFQITSHAAMIRRECFRRIGGYEPTYHVFGDRDWMLRFSEAGLRARHVDATVGLYLDNAKGLEFSDSAGGDEFTALRARCIEPPRLCRLFGLPEPPSAADLAALYAAAGSLGHRFYRWGERWASHHGFSAGLLQIALRHDPTNVVALNDLAILLAEAGRWDDATALLRAATRLAGGETLRWLRGNEQILERRSRCVDDYVWIKDSPTSRRPRVSSGQPEISPALCAAG